MRSIDRVVASALVAVAIGCSGGASTALERLSEARRLNAEALVQLTKASDASNRAVMAGTDEAAATHLRDAAQAEAAVQTATSELWPLLRSLGYNKETQLLREFEDRFAKYRELEGTIAGMVAESTNLKAQRLSFGPAREEADAVRQALEPIRSAAPRNGSSRTEALVAGVMSSVREIQSLQMPHILEPDDAPMTEIEKRMAAAEADARNGLRLLAGSVPADRQAQVGAASNRLEQFLKINAELLKLSRQNSNVHALALSLGQKRTLVAACEESLRALQDSLAKRGFTGTR